MTTKLTTLFVFLLVAAIFTMAPTPTPRPPTATPEPTATNTPEPPTPTWTPEPTATVTVPVMPSETPVIPSVTPTTEPTVVVTAIPPTVPPATPAPVLAASEPIPMLLPETGVDWKVLLSWSKVGAMLGVIVGGALVFVLGYAIVRRKR